MNWLALAQIAILGGAGVVVLALFAAIPAVERWQDRRRAQAAWDRHVATMVREVKDEALQEPAVFGVLARHRLTEILRRAAKQAREQLESFR